MMPQRHAERLEAFQDGISQLRAVAHLFFDLELPGALDEMTRVIHLLDKQCAAFALEVELPAAPPISGRKGRRVGVDIRPGSVKLARTEAGLSLRQLGGKDITAAAICLIEKGKSRPSMQTLQMIAARTDQSLEFFMAHTPWNVYATSLLVEVS